MILRQLENEETLSVYRLPFGTGNFSKHQRQLTHEGADADSSRMATSPY
jgi:hypothetical protein